VIMIGVRNVAMSSFGLTDRIAWRVGERAASHSLRVPDL